MCILLLLGGVFCRCVRCGWFIVYFKSSISLLISLNVLFIIQNGVLLSPAIIVELSILFISVSFCSVESLFWSFHFSYYTFQLQNFYLVLINNFIFLLLFFMQHCYTFLYLIMVSLVLMFFLLNPTSSHSWVVSVACFSSCVQNILLFLCMCLSFLLEIVHFRQYIATTLGTAPCLLPLLPTTQSYYLLVILFSDCWIILVKSVTSSSPVLCYKLAGLWFSLHLRRL